MIIFNKKGLTFKFESTGVEYGTVKYKYWISDIEPNKHNEDGFYYNAVLNINKKAFTFGKHTLKSIKINGKNIINGVLLEKDILEQVIEIEKAEIEKQENLIQQTINDVVSGKVPVTFVKVGCDYEYYEAYLESELKVIKDRQFDIIEKAMRILTGDDYCRADSLKETAKQIFGDDFIFLKKGNRFDIKLSELTDYVLKRRKENEEKQLKKENELIELAKKTGEKQVLKRWSTECNNKNEECDIDIITVWIDAEGNKETIRTHTW